MYRRSPWKVLSEKANDSKTVSDKDPLIGYLKFEGKDYKIPILAQRDPEKLPWKDHKVDVVIEATGKFATENGARKHAVSGAKRVVISAPSKGGNVGTYVIGVNDSKTDDIEGDDYPAVISNASCTTNCVAPVAAVMHSAFGVEKALMTTIHGYTDDQRLQDNSHEIIRRTRAAAMNIIPTTTGAAIATTETIPELKGLFDGRALRVPVATGSITDFTFVVKKDVTVDEVNNAIKEASDNNAIYKGILAVTNEPLVSSDIIGRTESAIVDLGLTQVVGGNLVKLFAWYDNEWGYTNRLVEQVIRVGKTLFSDKAPSDPISLTFSQNDH
jgi:glyceraldehyde 3-phosphate dehydrogenase